MAEYDGSNVLQHRYVFGPGMDEPIVEYDSSGNRRFLSADERGSIISASDSSGALLGIDAYDEYGRPGSGNSGRFQYTGQKWIGEAGLYDYKTRSYLAHLGIFAQTDPIGYDAGANLYAYVLNDPVNMVDPNGLCVFWGTPGDPSTQTTCPAGDPRVMSPFPDNEIVVTGTRTRRLAFMPTITGPLTYAPPGLGGGSASSAVRPHVAPDLIAQCRAKAVAAGVFSAVMDLAGLIPGERAISVVTRIFASSTQLSRALVFGDATAGALTAGGISIEFSKAGILPRSELAKTILGSIPFLNAAVVTASVLKDLNDTVEAYNSCGG